MFKRKIYDEMLKWKQEYAPKYAFHCSVSNDRAVFTGIA